MILAALLTGIALGAAAATAACRAWTSGALEDERARATRLENELLAQRRARAAERVETLALAHAEADPTDRLRRDATPRGAHHRPEEEAPHA